MAGAKAHYDRGSLEQVHAVAMAASDAVRTMGIGLTCCNLPGKPKSDRLNGLQMEVNTIPLFVNTDFMSRLTLLTYLP